MEIVYNDLAERFRTRLATCKQELRGELEREHAQARALQPKWDSLYDESAQVQLLSQCCLMRMQYHPDQPCVLILAGLQVPLHLVERTTCTTQPSQASEFHFGLQVLASLADIKADFAEGTAEQAQAFKRQVAAFYGNFKQQGPGRGHMPLSQGLKAMREADVELAAMLQQRNELVLSQKLFAMAITPYPELTKARCQC